MKSTSTPLKAFLLSLLLIFCPALAHAEDSEAPSDILTSRVAYAASPVIVTAADLVTKVYGAIDLPALSSDSKALSQKETVAKAGKMLKLRPVVEDNNVWLDSDAGYLVSYSGMTPQVSAVAQFDDDSLSGFSYFFIFPYAVGGRDEANRNQCAFCGSLLQEMYDMGSIVGVPVDEEIQDPDPLFTALGSYEGNHINVSLREQTQPDASGRFLLVLEVTPNVYNLYDAVMAQK